MDTPDFQINLPDEQSLVTFAMQLAAQLLPGTIVFLRGDLGAGKTSLCRGVLKGLGYVGNVKSPTYTLVEPYEIDNKRIYHFDLYRLGEPSELEYVGCRDYFDNMSICLVEWPEQGVGVLPTPDLELEIRVQGRGRELSCRAHSDAGRDIISRIQ